MVTDTRPEAFVYIWYHGPTKRYYLGSHKGTPDDGYSHSSTKMKSWNANNPPVGWKRRILFQGTHEQTITEESRLLYIIKSKKLLGNRYINLAIGSDPIQRRIWAKDKRKMKSVKYASDAIGNNHSNSWQYLEPDWD